MIAVPSSRSGSLRIEPDAQSSMMHRREALARMAALAMAASSARCRRPRETSQRPPGRIRIVFKHQPSWGQPVRFDALLDEFRRAHPDVELVSELLPSAADVLHQYYLTSLDGRADDFDVFVVDVVWVQEFARAGWIADLSREFPPERIAAEFLPGPAETVIAAGRTFAVPWFVDVGVLFYRTDLVPHAPRDAGRTDRDDPGRAPERSRAARLRLAGAPVRRARVQCL